MGARARATREAILDRAVQLSSAEGLEGLSIGRLAGELKMSKSGLFAHFGSKEELQLATVEEAARRFAEAVVAPCLGEPEGGPRLRAYCNRYLEYLADGVFQGGCFWAAAAAEFDDRPGAVRDTVRGAVSAWLDELARQAALAGAPDPGRLAFELYSLILGANAYLRLLGDDDALTRARASIDALLADPRTLPRGAGSGRGPTRARAGRR